MNFDDGIILTRVTSRYHVQGVMGLSYIFADVKPDPKLICDQTLYLICGVPPYKSGASCLDCAKCGFDPILPSGSGDLFSRDSCVKSQRICSSLTVLVCPCRKAESQLAKANCTQTFIEEQCAKNLDNGNIPPPDTVSETLVVVFPGFVGKGAGCAAQCREPYTLTLSVT